MAFIKRNTLLTSRNMSAVQNKAINFRLEHYILRNDIHSTTALELAGWIG